MKRTHNAIVLTGEPKSTQYIYRATCRSGFASTYMTAEGKALKEAEPLAGPISVTLNFHFKTKRKRDLDNQNKLILDALTGIAYMDDGQIDELHLYRMRAPNNPHVEYKFRRLLLRTKTNRYRVAHSLNEVR